MLALAGGGLALIFGFSDKILVPLALVVYGISATDLFWAAILIIDEKEYRGNYHLRSFEGLKFSFLNFKEVAVILIEDLKKRG